MTDAQFDACMLRIRQGDKESLKMIYQEYIAFIYSVIYGILKNKENAEDVTSEFFIKLWNVSDYYKPGGKHKGYLATIARNMAVDF